MMPPKFNDLTGQKIGKLTVIKLANIKKIDASIGNVAASAEIQQ